MLELQDPKVKMARFSVEFEVANNSDLILAQGGHRKKDDVRRMTIRGLVDPGATRLVLPLSVVKSLGVPKVEKTKTKYADGRVAQRDVVDEVRVNLLGRSGVFRAIVEPKRDSALIGAIVLEDLDFLVDCKLEKLVPRDPKQIVSEIECEGF
jgi:predicted aspartyl protease